ncbi:MAG: glycosyltransferase family 4 protein [Solirubrobacteraceae bacterium]
MRVHLVDPSAFTPPYDRALAAALARAGAEVTLVTSRFAYGPVPRADDYAVDERFYRWAPGAARSRARFAAKLVQHVPDMLRYRRAARGADVVHFQWLTVQPLDVHLLPPVHPLVLTAHDVLPREPRPGQRAAQRRVYERVDAVVVHSQHGARRLRALGVPAERLHVIPHGAFTHLSELPEGELPLPETERPVVLFFGLLREYKGIDVLLEAWRGIDDAELWIVGMPRMKLDPPTLAGVRFLPRYVSDEELAALFRRADLVALPYREIDQSGVLFVALAFGKPLLLSDAGGFPEVAAAQSVPAGDAAALHDALVALLADPERRNAMAQAALKAAATTYSWDAIARQTLALYEALLRDRHNAAP